MQILATGRWPWAGRTAPAKRRIPKTLRAGLTAACLCLALLGTAFTVNKDGILYHITAYATVPTAGDAVSRLHMILDSFLAG